jgi:hypothetical protein
MNTTKRAYTHRHRNRKAIPARKKDVFATCYQDRFKSFYQAMSKMCISVSVISLKNMGNKVRFHIHVVY